MSEDRKRKSVQAKGNEGLTIKVLILLILCCIAISIYSFTQLQNLKAQLHQLQPQPQPQSQKQDPKKLSKQIKKLKKIVQSELFSQQLSWKYLSQDLMSIQDDIKELKDGYQRVGKIVGIYGTGMEKQKGILSVDTEL